MLKNQNLGIRIFTNIQEIPEGIIVNLDLTVPGNTYLLYLDARVIGWGQILEYTENQAKQFELTHLNIQAEYRSQGYGRILVQYMLFHCLAQEIYLTTISPEFFLKLGFQEITGYPLEIDHLSAECQACQPANCRKMVFAKPAFLRRFTCEYSEFEQYNEMVKNLNFMRSEFSLVNECIWSYTENVHTVKIKDFLFFILFPFNEQPFGVFFPYPKIPKEVIVEFIGKLQALKINLIRYLNSHTSRLLQTSQKINFKIQPDRDNFDYLYKVSDFAAFSGGDFEKKRNRLKKFTKNHPDYKIIPYVPENNSEILNFVQKTIIENLKLSIISLDVLAIGLKHGVFQGFFVKIKEKIIGVLLYSELNKKTVDVHFEFADPEYDGVSQLMNNHLGQMLVGKYLFINREQDLGIPGLRKSKLSYRPYRLLRKYTAKF